MSAVRQSPAASHQAIFFDLDGVIHRGGVPTHQISATTQNLRQAGQELRFITNNASKTTSDVAALLNSLGVPCEPTEVITSIAACVQAMTQQLPTGSAVLVLGTAALRDAVTAAGFTLAEPHQPCAAVVQGFNPELTWRDLAAACAAITHGALWFAPNQDQTIPLDWGFGPGNGAMGKPITAVTGKTPITTGKPHPPMYELAKSTVATGQILFVGDRLDTDIAGAHHSGLTSALVLTGVANAQAALAAEPHQRPDYLLSHASELTAAYHCPEGDADQARCGDQVVRWAAGQVQLEHAEHTSTGDLTTLVHTWRAAAHVLWARFPDTRCPRESLGSGLPQLSDQLTSLIQMS